MGCNFYTLKGIHIGKRSATGLYCWDCKVILCKGDNKEIYKKCEWHVKCPLCGTLPKSETLDNNSAGRELGFNKLPFGKKVGVTSCSSFTWAISKEKLPKRGKIKDEYGKKYTIKEFQKILEECPVQFFESIGCEFS